MAGTTVLRLTQGAMVTTSPPSAPPPEQTPSTFTLHQNYPNPFNPTTNISFEIPVSGFVSLNIFDMLGREVATLVNKYKPAGVYVETLHATSLPSGVYFYTLKAGSFSSTKKMLLIK